MSSFYWSVKPRYSPGSPAWVDADTAARVLAQEWEGVEAAVEGIFGDTKQSEAALDDMAGIVTASNERNASTTDVYDLITGKGEQCTWRDGTLKSKRTLRDWDARHTIEALREQVAASLRAQRAAWIARHGHATVART